MSFLREQYIHSYFWITVGVILNIWIIQLFLNKCWYLFWGRNLHAKSSVLLSTSKTPISLQTASLNGCFFSLFIINWYGNKPNKTSLNSCFFKISFDLNCCFFTLFTDFFFVNNLFIQKQKMPKKIDQFPNKYILDLNPGNVKAKIITKEKF